MELKLQEKVKAAVEINGELLINFDNCLVYENINKEEAFFYIKTIPDPSTGICKEIKIRFIKVKTE